MGECRKKAKMTPDVVALSVSDVSVAAKTLPLPPQKLMHPPHNNSPRKCKGPTQPQGLLGIHASFRQSSTTTKRTCSRIARRRVQSALVKNAPPAHELDEFFAREEQSIQRRFVEKYNFDIVRDLPLRGRYEWVAVTSKSRQKSVEDKKRNTEK